MGNRYLIVSDFHLADIEDHDDKWMYYKSSRFVFDEEFRQLVQDFTVQGEGGDRLTLVLNGDIFDFDVITAVPDNDPWPISSSERKRGLNPTEEKSVWKLELVLSQHPIFVDTLADFVRSGHRLVYVMGNHDREFHFPRVQQVLVDALEESARVQGSSLARGTLRFEEWFYYVPDEIFAEHGNQYDYYTSFRYLLSPTVEVKGEQRLALPMGNLSNRYLMTRMGYFNPHASDFILNVYNYVFHWLRYYAFTRRNLFFSWLFGSLLVIVRLFKIKRKLKVMPPKQTERLGQIARQYDLSLEEVKALGQLHRPPITQKFYRLVRELWIDRLIIAFIMMGGTITLALVPIPLWIKLMVPLTGFPLLFFIYEWFAHGETIFSMEREIPRRARDIIRVLPAQVITFGHTHLPRLIPLTREATFVDTGAWAPITRGVEGKLSPGRRNYLQVSFHQSRVRLHFGSWME